MDLELIIQRLIAVGIIILVSFPVHEFAHAYVAYLLGDSTARYQGRLTLNPVAHFDPVGGIMLGLSALIGGFFIGWAKPTPVNVYNLKYGRRGDVLVSIAGPISNLILALVVALPLRLLLNNDSLFLTLATNDVAFFILGVVETFMVINIILMIFNLLPIPPLDGWHALLGLVDARTAYTLRQYEQYGFLIILLLIVTGAPFLGDAVSFIQRLLLGV